MNNDFHDHAEFEDEDIFLEDEVIWNSIVEGFKTTGIVFGLIILGIVIAKVFP